MDLDIDWSEAPEWLTPEDRARNSKTLAVDAFEALLAAYGNTRCPIDPCANDHAFVEKYGLEIEGKPFDFRAYKHLVDVYQDTARFLVLMAGAQTGKTARVFVHILRQMLLHWGSMFGYYLPTIDMASKFSGQRFTPFVRSQPEFARLLGADSSKGKGVDNVLTRSIGESTLFFLTTFGKSSTEGLPLQGVWFDEVRRMVRGDIERAMERYTAQAAPTDMKASTAMVPNGDIHRFFLQGDQRYFHTACRCPDGIVLSTTWPNCLMDLRGASPKARRHAEHAFTLAGRSNLGMRADELSRYPAAAFYCPKCDTVITDPQDGWWQPHNEGAWVHSYQMPQLLSPFFSAGRALYRSESALDIAEVHNSMLGLPYLDETQRPVREEHLYACVDTSLHWAMHLTASARDRTITHTAFGVDVQRGYLVVVATMRAPNGKHRCIHLAVLRDSDENSMWKQLGRLMDTLSCDICVIDNAPEWTAADRFARVMRGRVWLASYDTSGSPTAPIASWGDAAAKLTERKQKGKEVKFKHNVVIHRVKGLRMALDLWVHRKAEIPDPTTLIQQLPMQKDEVVFSANFRRGSIVPVPIASKALFPHMLQFVFRDLYDDPEQEERQRMGQVKMVAEYIGEVDPHFAHAWLYSAIALARIGVRNS